MTVSKYITTTEVASELGVHRATVVRWIKAGVLPAIRIGPRMFRIARKDIQCMLNRNH
ncbi:MAG: helix-turn-helix domain-containing protein [Acidobacteriaceae bacterium]|nr:helix-turn-helix domain-containing protein [Acidobacteriaceae bacterium]